MPKIKTHSGAKKRFKVTGGKKILFRHMNRNHILTKKSSKRKMHLRPSGVVDKTNTAQIFRMIPYAQ